MKRTRELSNLEVVAIFLWFLLLLAGLGAAIGFWLR